MGIGTLWSGEGNAGFADNSVLFVNSDGATAGGAEVDADVQGVG